MELIAASSDAMVKELVVTPSVEFLRKMLDLGLTMAAAVHPGFRPGRTRESFTVGGKDTFDLRAHHDLDITFPQGASAAELHAVNNAGLRWFSRAMDRCMDPEGIVAELFFRVLPDPVPENDEWPEVPMERGDIDNGIFSGEIEEMAVGMIVHTLYPGSMI